MSGTSVLLRARARAHARRFGPHHTKAEYAESMRTMAGSLLQYADDPDARASALHCLDLADQLEKSPRCGWWPHRPKGWLP